MDESDNPLLTNVLEPACGQRPATAVEDSAGDWLCAWCLNAVANECDRFQYQGKDHFSFINPAGMRFEIITFARAPGCEETGVPTLKDTWFAGHAWSFCHCESCGQHLGWYYDGPHRFVALIETRIVRALCVRN